MNRNLCTHPTLNRTTEGYAPAAGEREGGNILPRQGRGFERVRRVCPLEHLIQSRCSVEHVGLMYALQGYLAHTPLGSP